MPALVIRGKVVTLRSVRRLIELAGADSLKAARFWADAAQRRRLRGALRASSDFEQQYTIARSVFGLTQVPQEISTFLEFVAQEKPKFVCEIGTYDGGTNFLLHSSLQSVTTIIGIDLFVRNSAQLRYLARPGLACHYLNGSSYTSGTIKRVASLLKGNKLDVLFIDGDHSYDGVKKDFMYYRHFVQPGGLIAFHDIVPDHGMKYGVESPLWVGDVPSFWEQIKSLYESREFINDPEQGGFGIGVLRYDPVVTIPDDLNLQGTPNRYRGPGRQEA